METERKNKKETVCAPRRAAESLALPPMAKTAVLIDADFFLRRGWELRQIPGHGEFSKYAGHPSEAGEKAAEILHGYACRHIISGVLHRVMIYDCPPLTDDNIFDLHGNMIKNSQKSSVVFRRAFHRKLMRMRRAALRLGRLRLRSRVIDGKRHAEYTVNSRMLGRFLRGEVDAQRIIKDFYPDVQQKGVDIKLGLDIASLAYKKIADRIVLITGDADFVPAIKLARREGLEIILDPMWGGAGKDLLDHVDGVATLWPRQPSSVARYGEN